MAREILKMIDTDCPHDYEIVGEYNECEGKRCIDCWANALEVGDISDIYKVD